MRLATLILFFTVVSPTFSQESKDAILRGLVEQDLEKLEISTLDSSTSLRVYRIWFSYQQMVELTELSNSIFEGYVFNYVTRITGRGKKERKEQIVQKAAIPTDRIQHVMDDLKIQNIETLPDDDEIEGYPDGFDGTLFTFEIKNEEGYRIYSYWEPMNDRYTNEEIVEVANIRNIVRRLNSEFNLWEHFVKFRDRLPAGSYAYGGKQMIKFK